MFASKRSQVLVSNWYMLHVLSSTTVIYLQGCCVAPQYREPARPLKRRRCHCHCEV